MLLINVLKPFKLILSLCSKKILATVADDFNSPSQPDRIKALSAAFGVFMSILPIWGFQKVTGLLLAVVFKLNKTIVAVFLMLSFPPMMPLIIFLSYKAGGYWIGKKTKINFSGAKTSFQHFNFNLAQYIYGSITLAIVAGLVFGLLTFVLLKALKSAKKYKLSVS